MSYSIFILFIMIFLHIVDDYYLQGILANLKQKIWWEKNYPDKKYSTDYLVALFMHSFSWSFCVCFIPFLVSISKQSDYKVIIFFVLNLIIHMFVDDLKANKLKINLLQDQSIHLLQILVTWLVCILM